MLHRNYVQDIRDAFIELKENDDISKMTLEIQAASFIANEPYIFGTPNQAYIDAELEWYVSESLNVNDIELYYGLVPQIWSDVSSPTGEINSNYGWCVYSDANHNQFESVVNHLKGNPDSRHAVMYYTRPSMHQDMSRDGMYDHMCTFAVQYHLNNDQLDAHVYMRSNDAVYGYNNDVAWQRFVLERLAAALSTKSVINPRNIHWHASSLHVYPRHFHLVK